MCFNNNNNNNNNNNKSLMHGPILAIHYDFIIIKTHSYLL